MAGGKFGGGSGVESDPYLIEDAADLSAIRLRQDAYYKLVNNINLGVYPYNTGKGWMPIAYFKGQLDGNNKKIMNLYINRPDETGVGLFQKCENTNTQAFRISDIIFENANICGKEQIGIIAGVFNDAQSAGTVPANPFVERVTVTGTVKGQNYVGGLFGNATHTGASDCNAFLKDIFVNVNILPIANNKFFGAVCGCTAAYNGSITLKMQYVISTSTFSSIINGSNDASFKPYSFCNETVAIAAKTNCYFDNKRWVGTVTTNTTGVATEDMLLKTMSDFDKRYVGENKIWSYNEPLRYPQIASHIQDRFFVKTSAGYCIYEDGAWKVAFKDKPSATEADEKGMSSIDELDFNAWDALKNESTAEIVNFYALSNGTEKHEKTVDMAVDATASTGDKSFFRKEISFEDFGQSIFSIEKGVVY